MTSDFGNRLRKLRVLNGYTQQQLADRISVTRSMISACEQDKCKLGFDKLVELATIFDVSTDYLMGISDEHDEDIEEKFDSAGIHAKDRVMGIGKQIRALREERGLSRKDLANGLSLSSMAINKYERDVMAPSYGTLVDMARYFRVSTESLFGIDTGSILDISGLSADDKALVKKLVRQMR